MRLAAAATPLLILTAVVCQAQSDNSPHFEVVSIKRATGFGRFSGGPGSERATYEGTTLETLINEVYRLGVGQISGPSWIKTEFYSVTAKLPPDTTHEQYQQMMANLLAERFGLVIHHVTKEFPGYDLTVAPGGPRLTPSAPEEVTEALPAAGPRSFEHPMPDANGFPVLPPGSIWATQNDGEIMKMTFRRVTMRFLADRLRGTLSGPGQVQIVPVTDRTGLIGRYDFQLAIPTPAMWVTGRTNDGPDVGPPDISAALEKQLGLKLNPVKTKLDYIVVDKANKIPTEN